MNDFDDIVFANRHRAYGAYALRQAYRPTLSRAMLLGSGLFLGTLLLPRLYALARPDRAASMKEVLLNDFTVEKLPDEPIVVPPRTEPAPAVATVRNPVPEVVADAPDDVPDVATVEALQDAASGQTTQEGSGEVDLITAPETSEPTTIEKAIESPVPKAEEEFVVVEQQPEFPGGQAALTSFLQRNLRYPTQASRANVQGKVFISFTINTDGSLTNLQILKGLGFGTDEEALRVMHLMPRWKPGRQSGRTVRVRYNLPITFALEP